MAKINRWLLPEGVEEVLPKHAAQIEQFRRKALDMYQSYGYELVITPLLEYSDSLLISAGSDMDLQTFKVTDQLSGKMMAIRADMTAQTARIDARSLNEQGPTRLCYAGTVLHTKPKSQLASRVPIEVGAELYGDASIYSDIEVISLMLSTIETAGVDQAHLDLGHVGIYRSLVTAAKLSADAAASLLDAFDRKAKAEISDIVNQHCSDKALAEMIIALTDLHGDISVLAAAKVQLSQAPSEVLQAIDDLERVAAAMQLRQPTSPLFFDLVELRGYQYHTGLVFAAYIPSVGHAVANGGRYDGIGAAYGRARPATGFSVNVKSLLSVVALSPQQSKILAPFIEDAEAAEVLQAAVKALRAQGEVVVQALPGGAIPENCQRQLVKENNTWQVK